MYSLAGTDLDANDIFSNYPEDKASDFTPFGDYTPVVVTSAAGLVYLSTCLLVHFSTSPLVHSPLLIST